jgi:hypothetical protein
MNLSEWLSTSRYLPVGLMLDTLSEVDSALANRHRELGSGKQAILRDVCSCLAANGGGVIA